MIRHGICDLSLINHFRSHVLNCRRPIPEGLSAALQDFLQQCFNKDPTLRPSAELLCEHEWLNKSLSALKVCYCFWYILTQLTLLL